MPCYTDISGPNEAAHFETLLCKACKFLTLEQIELLTNPNSGICDGLDWYSQHLWLDCQHNNNDVLDFTPPDKQIALDELKRIGYEVIEIDGGNQLIKKEPL